ncbi:Peroxyureidoacrylate/ureidoacrylate amidohydrolase RutB [Bacillus sp. THAF10]|uniref:isochorismatase family cysteine hydrolase n=1 Tax=Bacillus sp. THAF10 TaxID=2587848 RepID=UPI00126950FB|nr:isochorismatase family cysteine hydrolase [Bacillus sp. THAF10]QFT87090.1 Peroxyureidoacrylate/ureidoacrylate amidohydrolase RutB [Bacillus sp. THAF10]
MNQTALLIIDIINDFQFKHGNMLAEKTEAILPNIVALKKQMRRQNLPIIYINDHYSLWQADYLKIIEKCRNSLSENIITELSPDNTDYFLIKPKHSAFYGTALNTLLAHLKIKKLILTGIAGNICVLFTANDAYMREYQLIVPKDAIASADHNDNEYALTMMENVLKAEVKKTANFLLH